jgi:hypothetical protein
MHVRRPLTAESERQVKRGQMVLEKLKIPMHQLVVLLLPPRAAHMHLHWYLLVISGEL